MLAYYVTLSLVCTFPVVWGCEEGPSICSYLTVTVLVRYAAFQCLFFFDYSLLPFFKNQTGLYGRGCRKMELSVKQACGRKCILLGWGHLGSGIRGFPLQELLGKSSQGSGRGGVCPWVVFRPSLGGRVKSPKLRLCPCSLGWVMAGHGSLLCLATAHYFSSVGLTPSWAVPFQLSCWLIKGCCAPYPPFSHFPPLGKPSHVQEQCSTSSGVAFAAACFWHIWWWLAYHSTGPPRSKVSPQKAEWHGD